MIINFVKADKKSILIAIIIRFLYTYLCIKNLTGKWYSGSGGYGISYNIYIDVVSWIVFILLITLTYRFAYTEDFTKTIASVLTIIYFIPLNASCALNGLSYQYLAITSMYWLLTIFCLNICFHKNGSKNYEQDKLIGLDYYEDLLFDNRVLAFFVIICIVSVLYKIVYNGFSFSISLITDDVYSNRAIHREYSQQITGSLLSYSLSILNGLAKYVAPIYLFSSLKRKSLIGIVLSMLSILAQFSVSSGKGTIFFVAVVIFIFIRDKHNKIESFNFDFSLIMLLILFACLIESFFTNNGMVFMVIIRRIMYLPAWLNHMYYEYVSNNGILLWSQNTFILQKIIPNRYSDSILNIISSTYFGGYVSSPNTGMFADAYMNAGLLGCVIYPVIYHFIFEKSSSVYKRFGKGLTIVVALDLALQISNVPILRTDVVLSFGLFTVMLYIIPKLMLRRN